MQDLWMRREKVVFAGITDGTREGGASPFFMKGGSAIPALAFLLFFPAEPGAMGAIPGPIRLPPGFQIDLYSGEVPGARSMALGDNGTLFVGTRREGKVYAVPDRNGDGTPEKVIVLARGLDMPNGVAFRDGALFVAETSRILRFDRIESRLTNPPKPAVVNDSFPRDAHHGWKFIRFGPDGKLYVPVGAPCNVCVREDPRYASIMRMNADGTGLEVFARGVRNTVGFDWHPETREMWFTDNGRDWMGDDIPPDELNRAPRQGLHFGFPYRHGIRIPDRSFPRRWSLDRTSRPWECASTRDACFRNGTGTGSSSRSTAPGIVPNRSDIA